MREIDDSKIVCIDFCMKYETITYPFDMAIITYCADNKIFDDYKDKKVIIDTEQGVITSAKICMRYDLARQFLKRLGFCGKELGSEYDFVELLGEESIYSNSDSDPNFRCNIYWYRTHTSHNYDEFSSI